jgi:hypothetical protein
VSEKKVKTRKNEKQSEKKKVINWKKKVQKK